MWKVYEKAKSNILKASGNPKWQYYVKYYQNKYKVRDTVWLHTFNRTKHKSPKLQRNWHGPYLIVAVLSNLIYKIQSPLFPNPKLFIMTVSSHITEKSTKNVDESNNCEF